MALMKMIIAALAVAAMVAAPALAKEFIVGDEAGWKLNFNYQDWAKGKNFQVGDKLIFNYKEGSHNVIKVDGNGFKECSQPENNEPLTTGNDMITLATPGKKWYICGISNHCGAGMKLAINVQSQGSSDSASPNSAAEIAPRFLASMVAAAFCVFVFMMIGGSECSLKFS